MFVAFCGIGSGQLSVVSATVAEAYRKSDRLETIGVNSGDDRQHLAKLSGACIEFTRIDPPVNSDSNADEARKTFRLHLLRNV